MSGWRSSGICCASPAIPRDRRTPTRIGFKGKPVRTIPVETGYSYHSESNFDIMQPVLSALAEHFEAIDLPLRSIENEWGPGQLECTFAPHDALTTADNLILFRSATRQITRRMGYLATFMARPAIAGFCASGWHLHQSLADASGKKNLFTPDRKGDPLSPLGMHYLAGLLAHAQATHALHHADHQRLSALQAELARTRPRHLGL